MKTEPADRRIGPLEKGFPPGEPPLAPAELAARGWSVLAGDLPLPLLVLKRSALERNARWMRAVLAAWPDACLAPHGKTTMSPELFRRQLADGAWAITLATLQQVRVARAAGVARVLLANPLVGRVELDWVVAELARDPAFELLSLVDGEAHVERLAAARGPMRSARAMRVLLELGVPGGRTGVRSDADALALARRVRATPGVELAGVEGFEGILRGADAGDTERRVAAFVDRLVAVAAACRREGLFEGPEIVLSAGGSAWYDVVLERLARFERGPTPHRLVLRSGCYLTHDAGLYARAFEGLRGRLGARVPEGLEEPENALELLTCVLSRPEPTRAVLGFGKRDAAADDGMPRPLAWCRPAPGAAPRRFPDSAAGPGGGPERRIAALNDQHAWLDLRPDDPLSVGDVVLCGISHPCLTLDKWTWLPVVDDAYRVVDAVRTFF